MSKKYCLPEWAYYDNQESHYAMIASDMLKADQYKELSTPAKMLYLTMRAHAQTKECIQCLRALIKELDESLYLNTPEIDISNSLYKRGVPNKFFVFPRKQFEQYGYDSKTVWKYKEELLKKGFITCVVKETRKKRVSIYAFSGNWKRKAWCGYGEKDKKDHVIPFWNGNTTIN